MIGKHDEASVKLFKLQSFEEQPKLDCLFAMP